MVPCYIDMFYPQVGVAAVELLEKLGVEVDYPFDQTCCGQPMANSGASNEAKATEELFIRNFAGYDHIVAPSGSCVHHLRNKFTAARDSPGAATCPRTCGTCRSSCATCCGSSSFRGRSFRTRWRCTQAARPSAGSA
jgi:hypothetical protein